MRQEIIRIRLPEEQAGTETEGEGARLTCLLRDNTSVQAGRKRPAVVICPGGAYERLSDREAQPVAFHFLAAGYQAFVLEYSVAPSYFPRALLELAWTVAFLRDRGEEWGIDDTRIFVCGFSAGGHLAASLGVFWDRAFVWETLKLTRKQIRPDGLILCYPVISFGEYGHKVSAKHLMGPLTGKEGLEDFLSLEKQAGPQAPPVFMWHTDQDMTVPLENSLLFAWALRKAGVSLEYHVFPRGRHGIALADGETDKPAEEGYVVPSCQCWIQLACRWIKEFGPDFNDS